MMKKFLALILCAGLCLGMSSCVKVSSERISELKNKGYAVSLVDNNVACITEDGVNYFFEPGVSRPKLKTIVLTAPSQREKVREAGYQVTVTFVMKSLGRRVLLFDDPRLRKGPSGEDELYNIQFRFEFKDGFSEDDLTNNRGFHDVARDYRSFQRVLSLEEIQRIYDRGLELENLL
ncbi:MAG: hypothetical protein K6F45_10745 [Saccharofermentans sp.]|nr:hypothetical protein [Saccharofermentans sp.]